MLCQRWLPGVPQGAGPTGCRVVRDTFGERAALVWFGVVRFAVPAAGGEEHADPCEVDLLAMMDDSGEA